ncbi:SET domain-containing protein [Karstenula rhodostoma CBS 690.94]|uniref:SET domain-containing protein n=1 Tax=Karstenula rhodostoma CBS 690.94 TaxID=1392251 RepID=A0A9P4UJM6_9PLEO|nr:SET domain-containing protein [Karstenula rhodostoma CBS 690.94]
MSTCNLVNHLSQVICDRRIVLVKENTFDHSRWRGTKKPILYTTGKWPPTSVEDLLGSPAEEEECAVCQGYSPCRCDYPLWSAQMQLFLMDNLLVSPTPGKGYGIFTRIAFDQDQVIGEYTGELVPIDKSRSNEDSQYVASISIGKAKLTQKGTLACRQAQCWIDASRKGSVFRFLNHSCDWNAALMLGRVGMGRRVMMVVTTKPIAAGEEITIDYGKDYWQPGLSFFQLKLAFDYILVSQDTDKLKVIHETASLSGKNMHSSCLLSRRRGSICSTITIPIAFQNCS